MLNNKPESVKERYKARTAHYLTYIGLPLTIHERRIREDTVLGLLEFGPRNGTPFYTYVTSGMSEIWQSTPSKSMLFTEMLIYSRTAAPWIMDFLAKLSDYPFTQRTFFASGQTLPLAGPIVPDSELTSLAFLRPMYEHQGFEIVSTISTKRIELLWVLP